MRRGGRLKPLIFVCILLLNQLLHAETQAFCDSLGFDSKTAGQNCARIVCSPFRADAKEWLIVGGIASGVAASALLDSRVHDDIRDIRGSWAGSVDDIGHAYQQTYVPFSVAGLLYGYGLLTGRTAVRRVGIEIVEALILAGAGTQLSKHLLGRARPCTGNQYDYFEGATWNDDYHSFPSGDVTKAFTLSSVLASEIKFWPATVGLYGLAGATAFQRLHSNRHWFSDVAGAAVWGTAVGLGVVYVNHRRLSNRASIEFGLGSVTFRWM